MGRRHSAVLCSLFVAALLAGCGGEPEVARRDVRSVAAAATRVRDAGGGTHPETPSAETNGELATDPNVASGRVLDADGNPVRGGWLRPRDDGRAWASPFQSDGTFRLWLNEATPECDVEAALNFEGSRDEHWVSAGHAVRGRTDLVLRLPPILVTTGTLLDANGRPLPGWTVVADAHPPQTGRSRAVTDESGAYTLRSFAPLRPGLTALDPDRRRSGMRAQPGTGGATRFRVTGSVVSGSIVCEDGGSSEGALVRLLDDNDRTAASVLVDRTSSFAFDALPADARYRVVVELSGYTAPEPKGVLSGGEPLTLYLAAESQVVAGRALDTAGEPLRVKWISFVDAATKTSKDTCTDIDGNFSTLGTRGAAYETFLVEPGTDGRLVAGRALGRCVAGSTSIELRATR